MLLFTYKKFFVRDNKLSLEEFNELKIKFQGVLGKHDNEIWTLKKIIKILKINKDFIGFMNMFNVINQKAISAINKNIYSTAYKHIRSFMQFYYAHNSLSKLNW